MNLNVLGVFLLSGLALTSPLAASTISPDSDSSGMFAVMSERAWIEGADARSDRQFAVETSYFEYRESTRPVAGETPFAPRMPRVETNSGMALTQEESQRLMTRR
ncbi:MAG: hypothetical protein IPJ98_22275 [Bryobacterales bacterium]|nr:hypothetical protein [Bryobacterales bacterium]